MAGARLKGEARIVSVTQLKVHITHVMQQPLNEVIGKPPKHIYAGSVSADTRRKRRAKNKTARRSRQTNRRG